MSQWKRELYAEREMLKKRLNWLGLRSTGSEVIERRIEFIDRVLGNTSSVTVETNKS